jgi:hypothetical protein
MEQLEPGPPKKHFSGLSMRFGAGVARTFPKMNETNSRRKMTGRRWNFETFWSLPSLESLVDSGSMGNQEHVQMIKKPRLHNKKALQSSSVVNVAEPDILAQIDLAVVDSPHSHTTSMLLLISVHFLFHDFLFCVYSSPSHFLVFFVLVLPLR